MEAAKFILGVLMILVPFELGYLLGLATHALMK